MLICERCFSDEELKAAVRENATSEGVCEVCHSHDKLIDLSEFFEFFDALLTLFEPAKSAKTIVEIIQDDWSLFYDNTIAAQIIGEKLQHKPFGYLLTTPVDYANDLKDRIAIWERLKTTVKEETRFFTNIDEFAKFNYLQLGNSLHKGDKLFRSRITPAGQKKLRRDKMGCPSKAIATAGRANPIGIPYLYLSDSAKTTYFEVRAVYLDNLSVGTFEIVREQKLVDFIYEVNLYLTFVDGIEPLKEIIIRKKIIDAISKDLSKPLQRYDSELEYVPTQWICEYCRLALHADGVCFDSSLHKGGKNYVLFDESAAVCRQVDSHKITQIDIDIAPKGNQRR